MAFSYLCATGRQVLRVLAKGNRSNAIAFGSLVPFHFFDLGFHGLVFIDYLLTIYFYNFSV